MDLAGWLRSLGLEQYEAAFREAAIDETVLRDLTEDHLRELGFPLGARLKLLKAIAALDAGAPAVGVPAGLARPDTPADAGERRHVTVLFSDLVGSTALSARMDPEDLREVISAYQKCVAESVRRFGGFVAKYLGDGVLVYFGYPHAHEDDADRAVRAGLELIAATSALALPVSLQTRVGIATGLVVVGDLVGSGEAQERGIVGETPNLAARLQGIAAPDTVVIADGTRRLLGHLFDFEDLGATSLKGIDGPVRAWRVLRASAVASRFEALRATSLTALVGREEEFELLLRRWSRAQRGEGQVVLFSGEAGIGKSRLAAALMERLAGVAHAQLCYFCSPQHTDSALHPVIVQMERAAGLAHDDTAPARLDKLDALLAPTATAREDAALFAELLSLANDGRYPALELAPPQRRHRTLQALVTQVEALARQRPVLMVFEDAHWTDPTTLELLGRVVDRIASLPVLLIMTFRPEFNAPWIGRPHVTALILNRLAQRDVGAMIDRVVGNKPLPGNVRQDIIERTDGIPLFVEEMTKAILEADDDDEALRTAAAVPSSALAVPASLHASLMARIDRLGPGKEVAQLGAAIGREFSHALLAAVARKPDAELEAALERLLEAGLLSRQGMPPYASYLFKHALVQDAAYGMLLREPRRALHARIAEALETRFSDVAQAEPEIVAHHFSRADLAGPASGHLERAGDRAVARSAYAEAVAHFSAALAQLDRLPASTERSRHVLDILLKQGPAVLILRGLRSGEVEQIYQRAYDIAKSLGDEPGSFKALWGLWFCANLSGRTDVARDRVEELVALGQRSGDESLFLEAIHCRWSTAFFRGDVPATLAGAREGLALYDPARHSRLGAEFGGHDPGVCAHTVAGLAFAQSGRPRAAAESVERGIALARTLSQPPSVAFAIMNALTAYAMIGDRTAVTRLASQMTELADRFDLPSQRAIACFMSAWARACGNELESGLQAMESEFPRVSATGPIPVYYTGLLAGVRLEAGQPRPALELLDGVLKTESKPGVGLYLPEIHRLRGECLLRLAPGDLDAAVRELEAAIAAAKEQQAHALQLAAAISLARAWAAAGRGENGIAHLQEAAGAFDDGDGPAQLALARAMLAAHS
ncbi:MAG TPA: adenylate/guanylate cyclase domain-containing protein [Xanthobacteraceae bacterium]